MCVKEGMIMGNNKEIFILLVLCTLCMNCVYKSPLTIVNSVSVKDQQLKKKHQLYWKEASAGIFIPVSQHSVKKVFWLIQNFVKVK